MSCQDKENDNTHKVGNLSVAELFKEIRSQLTLLMKKEIELAKTELKADLKAEAVMAGGLGVAAIGGVITVVLLLVTCIFALALVVPGWVAGLLVSGFVLLCSLGAALYGWTRRVKSPLVRSREVLRGDISMTKEGFA